MKTFTNFDEPTQVMFYDGSEYHAGIAYHDEVICGCCGGTFEVADINEMALEDKVVPIVALPWVDFSEDVGLTPDELQEEIDREGLAD